MRPTRTVTGDSCKSKETKRRCLEFLGTGDVSLKRARMLIRFAHTIYCQDKLQFNSANSKAWLHSSGISKEFSYRKSLLRLLSSHGHLSNA